MGTPALVGRVGLRVVNRRFRNRHGAGGSGTICQMSPAMNQPVDGRMKKRLRASDAGGRRGALGMMLVASAGLSLLALGGCGKPLLSPDEERSPFDRYDGIRAQYAPQYTTDEYGLRKPNLRNRLGNKD